MSWRWLLLLTTTIFLLVSCSQQTTTNRIFSNRARVTAIVPRERPLSVNIGLLRQAPEAYEGTLVRVTSEYRRAPIIICDGIARVPPAAWRLGQDDSFIAAGGFDNVVRALLPSGMTITVDGVWRHWRGPVGCGKEAPVQSLWYLDVIDIVSPSPVARVTLTPAGGAPPPPEGTEPPVEEEATLPATEPAETATTGPSPGDAPTAGATNTLAAATPLATQTPAASPTAGGTLQPTATLTATTEANGTVTATATATNGATATATVGASPTPGGAVVDRGSISYQDLRGGRLDSGETHSWQFPVEAGDVITISVAAREGANITLAVLDPGGNRIVDQDNSPAGQIEVIGSLEASGSGGYRVVIAEAGANETYYSVLILNSNDPGYEHIIFEGLLSYGSLVSGSLPEFTDHMWFFFGNGQEVININVAPTNQSNLFISLYSPDGEVLEDAIDDAGNGGAEQLMNFRLPATGMYGIYVGEVQYAPANYTVLVSRN